MSFTIATGTAVAIASAYGTGFTISDITNANPAVATLSASHGVIVGDVIEISSGWDLLDKRLVRVSAVATNDVTLQGINTLNTSRFPVGTGGGTGREVSGWTNIAQIKGMDSSGGDLSYANITTWADRVAKQVPTIRSAKELNFLVYDDPTLSWYPFAEAATDLVTVTGLRFIFSNNSKLYANGYYNLDPVPDVASQEALTAKLGFSAVSAPIRYTT